MPNPMTEAAVQSIELEEVDGKIAELIPLFEDDLAFFEKRAKKVNIANETAAGTATGRPAWRNTMVIQGGAPIVTGTGDQTSLLRGTGINTAAFAQSPDDFEHFGALGRTQFDDAREFSIQSGHDECMSIAMSRFDNRFDFVRDFDVFHPQVAQAAHHHIVAVDDSVDAVTNLVLGVVDGQ